MRTTTTISINNHDHASDFNTLIRRILLKWNYSNWWKIIVFFSLFIHSKVMFIYMANGDFIYVSQKMLIYLFAFYFWYNRSKWKKKTLQRYAMCIYMITLSMINHINIITAKNAIKLECSIVNAFQVDFELILSLSPEKHMHKISIMRIDNVCDCILLKAVAFKCNRDRRSE